MSALGERVGHIHDNGERKRGTCNPCNVPMQEGSNPRVLSIKSLSLHPFLPTRAGLVLPCTFQWRLTVALEFHGPRHLGRYPQSWVPKLGLQHQAAKASETLGTLAKAPPPHGALPTWSSGLCAVCGGALMT